ncbi:matrixin family metalloprotease [Candidatus Nitrospira bockiana]
MTYSRVFKRIAVVLVWSCCSAVNAFALPSWVDYIPETPRTDIYYDFRSLVESKPNYIPPAYQRLAVGAMDMWSRVADVNFIRNPWAPSAHIINIGMSWVDGPAGILGQGGYRYLTIAGERRILSGFVLLDGSERWDAVFGNGDQPGTFDLFTVFAHEVGHALGLEHTSTPGDVMYTYYSGEKIGPSLGDVTQIRAAYGSAAFGVASTMTGTSLSAVTAVPEPSTVFLLGSGIGALVAYRLRHRRTPRSSGQSRPEP